MTDPVDEVAGLVRSAIEARRTRDVAMPLFVANVHAVTEATADVDDRQAVVTLLADMASFLAEILESTVTAAGAPLPPWVDLWVQFQHDENGRSAAL